MSAETIRLADDQLAELAALVAMHLQAQPSPAALVDAQQLAAHLSVDRSWIYAHAGELGGKRLGSKRGRLRFDLAQASAAFAASSQPEHEQPRSAPRRRRAPARAGTVLRVRA